MQRRRSFDGMEGQNVVSKKPTPTPLSSVSARVTTSPVPSTTAHHHHHQHPPHHPQPRGGINVPKINTAAVPFPRGGRQIGQNHADTHLVRRSNSIERNQFRLPEDHPPKKRHLFRFGKKKNYPTTPTNASAAASANNSTSTASSSNTTATSTSSNHNNMASPRKKSNDADHRSLLSDAHTPASDVQRYYYQQQMKDERKRSAGSNGSGNSHKKNNKDNGRDQLLHLKLDQNFEKMDGIVNKDYYKSNSPAPTSTAAAAAAAAMLPSTTNAPSANLTPNGMDTTGLDLESWAPPDSWGVQPPSIMSASTNMLEEDHTDFEDYQIDVQEKWDVPKKNANIKIYRPDKTYNTLHVPLNSTTLEILKKLATKFFMSDITKFNLVMKRHNIERILGLTERPLQIQKLLQEQMGYMDQDKIDDSTYLVRFQMMPNIAQPVQEDKDFGQHVDLQSRSLATIPIYLYKHASRIVSLDISKNLHIEIPLDFIQMCTSLKQLWLANNEYLTLPPSTQHISSLEHLNISGNRLRDLDHANLHEIAGLRTLRAINNRLESIPDSFATCFDHLTTLFISNNSFTKFPMVICEILTLAYLDISFNKIQMFPEEIGQLTNLVGLFAIANRITGALPASFVHLTKLQELDIRQNLITDLDVVSHLPRLEILLVDYNSTSIVNFEIKSLKQLKMYKNHLTQFNLTSGPGGGTCLTELNLSCCKLSSLPEELFNNTQGLERLVLDSNTLNSIPSSIGALQKLVKLSIQNNNLETLPAEIGKLSELKALDAQKNNLKSLPKEIWLCSSLQTLNCSSNLLESFPEPLSTITPCSTPLANKNTGDDISDMTLICDEDDDMMMNIIPPALNAGQGVVKRLDHLLDYNSMTRSTSRATFVSSNSSTPSPVTPSVGKALSYATVSSPSTQSPSTSSNLYSPDQPMHPHHLTPQQQQQQSASPPPAPNFNPPSFFASPRNHPPPLSLSLRQLFLGDNRFTDDIWSPLSLFLELRTLNLSFNDLYEVPPDGLCHQHLYELYLSGNQLTSLPADDIERLQYMRVLAVNGNKLQTLPAEIGKLRKLLVLDVGNNVLKYNIANWPYDWNWNWNLGLKYLNLSGNKRLEIQKMHPDPNNPKDKDLSDFSALTRLRMLGLMDITILGVSVPEEFHDRRVRTSPSEVNSMSYGVADWLGPSDHLSTWDLVMPRFRSKEDECIFALFDGSKHPKSGCRLTKQLNDTLTAQFTKELASIKSDDTIVSAVRRVFLGLEQSLGTSPYIVDKDSGASAVLCYISGTKLYVANVGDALAVISRNNGQAFEITQKHIPLNPSEVSRIRAAGGHVSNSGLLNNELHVSRSFGHFHLVPVVNCNPFVSTIDLTENDEFVIMASRGLWDKMTYQTAVDIARTQKDDLMAAAQKLRDFAITYGATDNLMVMVIGVGDLFDKREKRYRGNRGNNMGPGRGVGADVGAEDGILVKSKRRGKEEVPGDSTLARLEREVAPPVSQLALVFTDIKSSTQFWETQPENMRSAIKIHDAIMRRTLRSVGGYEVKTEGDAFMVCFKNITAALLWCFTVQLQLLEADWPAGILDTEEGREIEKDGIVIYKGLSVRMGIHWGSPVFERNPITQRMDYFGPVVNKASRICNAADGGQICVSSDVIAALRNFPSMFDEDAELQTNTSAEVDAFSGTFPVSRDLLQLKQLGFHVVELGERRLKGLETPETLSLVYSKQLLARIEVDKSEMMATGSSPIVTPSNIVSPKAISSIEASPALTTAATTDSSNNMTSNSSVSTTPMDYLTARPIKHTNTRKVVRTIDPNLVCAMSNLAIRLERLTSGNVLSQHMAGSSINREYTLNNEGNEDTTHTVSTAPSGLGLMLDRHIREDATDEELVIMMENCVARVENAVSSLYLQKVGHFAGVLEKLGEAIDMDPMHIIKALQMYAESASLAAKSKPL
ncbi:cysteinyl-tRNA synthetase, variant 2 [Mucor circinelloides]